MFNRGLKKRIENLENVVGMLARENQTLLQRNTELLLSIARINMINPQVLVNMLNDREGLANYAQKIENEAQKQNPISENRESH